MSADAYLVHLLDLELEVRVLESLLAMTGERRVPGRRELQRRLAVRRAAAEQLSDRLLAKPEVCAKVRGTE